MKAATYKELDSAIFKWLKTARHSNILTTVIYLKKTSRFSKIIRILRFSRS